MNRRLHRHLQDKTSNDDKKFFVQIPSKLLPFHQTLAPNGIGSINTPVNADVKTLEGQVIINNFCGVYRSYLFILADQEGQKIQAAFTSTKYFQM